MSFRRIFVILLLGSLFSFVQARETEPVYNVDDVQRISASGECSLVLPKQTERGLSYIFFDHIVVHSGLEISRCVQLKNLPFTGYYKLNVIAMYDESGPYGNKEEYQLVVDGIPIGDVVLDQNDLDPDDERTGTVVPPDSIYKPKEDYLYVRNDHGYVYLDKANSVINFKTGSQFENGGTRNSVDFYGIEVVPPPHVIKEPEFTAGNSNTIEWKPLADGVLTQEVYCYDNTGLAKSQARLPLHQASSTQGSEYTTTFEGLSDGHQYGYYVETNLTNGQTVRSATTFSTQDASPPTVVKIGSISSLANRYVYLFWNKAVDAGSGVDHYLIVRSEDNSEPKKLETVATIPAASVCEEDNVFDYCFTDTIADNLPYKVFTYRIDAVDAVGNVSTGVESDVVMEVKTPGLKTNPVLVDEKYYKGATITLVADLENVVQPEYHQIRFQAVRDNIDFFEQPVGVGQFFFDSSWQAIPKDAKSFSYPMDLTNGNPNQQSFVNGHTYYFRVQLRDLQDNYSAWSDVLPVIPDCFAPSDINFVTATSMTDEANTEGWIEVRWGGAQDLVSKIDSFYVYRKTSAADTFRFVEATKELSYKDSFDAIGRNGMVTYRIGSVDKVGNSRGDKETSIKDTNFEASAWCQAALKCTIVAKNVTMENGIKTTTDPDIILQCNFKNYDKQDSIKFVPQLNGVEEKPRNLSPGSKDKISYTLPDRSGIYKISVKALFPNKSASVWSLPDSIQYISKNDTTTLAAAKEYKTLVTANHPNPFNPSTTISFELPNDAQVQVDIYNVKGQKIKSLTNEFVSKGVHAVTWNGDNEAGHAVSSGIYYYKIQIDGVNKEKATIMKRMLLIK